MFSSLKENFFWQRIKIDALEFSKKCVIFQKVKVERVKILGKLQPLDNTHIKWESISMEFIMDLSKVLGNFDSIVVKKTTKVAYLISSHTTTTTSDIANSLLQTQLNFMEFQLV